jgi:BirA family biotin operon repressor/biotin-[acetyl-CoA-carboxylase] ligase
MLNELDRLYADFVRQGFGPVREEWQERCNAKGRELVVSDAGQVVVRGMFGGIDGDGALLVQRPDGRVERILSGDVRVI